MFVQSERKGKGVEMEDKIYKHISFSCFFLLSFRATFFPIFFLFVMKRVEQKEKAVKLSDSVV